MIVPDTYVLRCAVAGHNGPSSGTSLSPDTDECGLGTDACHQDAICTNVDGWYSCTCRDGFSGDGFQCVPGKSEAVPFERCY